MKTFYKQPHDKLDYDVDYSDWLVGTDELVGATVTTDGDVTIESYTTNSNFVKIWISGGTNGKTSKITCVAETADGRLKEKDFKIKVKER